MARRSAVKITSLWFEKESVTFIWAITNWVEVQKNDFLLLNTTTTSVTSGNIPTKCELRLLPKTTNTTLSWKLLELPNDYIQVEACIRVTLLKNDGEKTYNIGADTKMLTKDIIHECPTFNLSAKQENDYWNHLVDIDGTLKISIELTFFSTPQPLKPLKQTENSVKIVFPNILQAYAKLLNDSESADLKIVTSDKQDIFAHKLIIKAQCPTLASMFPKQFSEKNVSTIEILDVPSQTMKILLQYWYTGELLSSWADDEIVVEFLSAVGKFRITELLEMLDSTLGSTEIKGTRQQIDLLRLANKFLLKNAQQKLTDKIIESITKIRKPDELLALLDNVQLTRGQGCGQDDGMLVRVNK